MTPTPISPAWPNGRPRPRRRWFSAMDLFGWVKSKSGARPAAKPERQADTHLAETQRNQAAAADPASSAWVSANAGTGKTHVLTMRVLRLLLAGTAPERILALTYTKAAAAEMSKRVFARLAEWVTAPDAELSGKLEKLLDRPPTTEESDRARQLFAIAIETPGGLKVQTIHAFCERLLQRFPLEAGVPPGFAILDDHERSRLLAEAADETLGEATSAAGTPLARALGVAIKYSTDFNFDQLLAEVAREQAWLDAAARLGDAGDETFAAAEAIYRRAIGIGPDVRREDVEAELASLLSETDLRRAAGHPGLGLAQRRQGLRARRRRAARQGAPATAIDALCAVFITGNGDPRKNLMTQRTGRRAPRRTRPADARPAAMRGPQCRARQAHAARGRHGAAGARQRGHAALRRGQGAPRRARLRRPGRQDGQPSALLGRGRVGALQARWRPRPHPGRRGAGHEPRAVERDPRAGRGVLLGCRRQRDDAHAVCRRRREAVDLWLPGRRAREVCEDRRGVCPERARGGIAVAERAPHAVVPVRRAAAGGGRPDIRDPAANPRRDRLGRADRARRAPHGARRPRRGVGAREARGGRGRRAMVAAGREGRDPRAGAARNAHRRHHPRLAR